MPKQGIAASNFEAFLDGLSGKSVAIVYSYSDNVDRDRVWYHRWRSEVVMYFGQGAEEVGLDVRYLDVDTYLSQITTSADFSNDFVINLHSGVRDISNWPIISSLASWKGIPVGFCPSDVHITCERKDITNALASDLRFRLPAAWSEKSKQGEYVIKHRDLGMSSGLKKSADFDTLLAANLDDRWIVEEFIPGYDATVALVANTTGSYSTIGARIYLPTCEDPETWMFTEEMKLLPVENGAFEVGGINVSGDLSNELKKLSSRLGAGAIYRYDLRVGSDKSGALPATLDLSNSWLLEVTPTPTISANNDFGHMLREALETPSILAELAGNRRIYEERLRTPRATLVANVIFKSVERLRLANDKTPATSA